MPYAERLCGVYSITSPCGGVYIGSSKHIKHRFSEHRSDLRLRRHRSPMLQEAYELYGKKLEYKIEEICDEENLLILEQEYMDKCEKLLNESHHTTNVWLTPKIREKLEKTLSSKEHREKLSILRSIPNGKWVSVDCSDGRTFPSYAIAAREFNVTTTRILMLCKTQKVGNLGVKFKKSSDEWITEYPKRTRKPHSEETRALMRANRKNWKPGERAIRASAIVNSKAVIGTDMKTGKELFFNSQHDAAVAIHPNKSTTASSQISKAISGTKKSAYGYYWKLA